MLLRLATLTAVLSSTVAFGQQGPLEHQGQAWGLITGTGHLQPSKRVRWYAEVQSRIGLTDRRFNLLLLRAALGFDIGAGWSVWLGNGWVPSFNPSYRSELRPWLQVSGEHTVAPGFRVINRSRFEVRFLDNAQGISVRVRHMVRAVYKLGDSPYSLVASDELFVTVNKVTGGPAQGLDQNRLFIGASRSFGVPVLEVGYLATYVWRSPAPRLSHTALVWLAFNFP